MASFSCRGAEVLEILAECAGYKGGLALSENELREHLATSGYSLPRREDAIRMRFEELDRLVRELLYAIGALRRRPSGCPSPSLELLLKYQDDSQSLRIIETLQQEFVALALKRASTEQAGGPLDITPVLGNTLRRHGAEALPIVEELYQVLDEYIQGSFSSRFRRTEWRNTEELRALFESEDINPVHGEFLDQRFIDYLERNFDAVDSMQWRKFEALAAEFFEDEGYQVELGPGRSDGGVDVRVWSDSESKGAAPMVLVQCKRQRQKVGMTVVKALWADVVDECAQSGLIVTTTALSPGAQKMMVARSYPIEEADRGTIAKWLQQLRTPGAGLFAPS